ncbi:MAG: HlyC/CorC family transporter [Candidatus Sericytochromatia bacterium]|nr:HlyC/CorC family transporter [Candidatus Sericytochromatia bacterium]
MFETVLLPAFLILLLLFLNALFVAAEFAIVMTSTLELQQLATAKQSGILQKLIETKTSTQAQDAYIATAQLGITLASLGLGMYGEYVLAEGLLHFFAEVGFLQILASHSVAGILAVAGLTYFHVVLGEMVPKTLALQRAGQTALRVAPVMFLFKRLMFPLVYLLNQIGNFLLKMLKLEGSPESENQTTLDDFHYIVEESENAGLLSEETADILQDLLAFSDLKARDIMIPRVQTQGLALNASPDKIRAVLSDRIHSRYPVYGENLDEIVGFVHVRDLLILLTQTAPESHLHDLNKHPEVIRSLPFVSASAPLEIVLQVLQQAHVQMAGVLDEYGGTAGILTLTDICAQILDTPKNKTTVKPEIEVQGEFQIEVSANLRLHALEEFLGKALEHPEVETIGGLVLLLLGHAPQIGDRLQYGDFEIQVSEIEGRGVKRCRIQVQDRN